MGEESSFDAFKLCCEIIFQESAKWDNKYFDAKNCKIQDTRDTNFNVVENRLAFTYKYGYFNILFFEKCFSLFINECSTLFPFENLKLCSLSNGPGFDITGLLSALCIFKKPLKCLPVFNAVNFYESWCQLYKTLVYKAYETCIARSFVEYFHLNPTNINLIQGDIYSPLSNETKNFISNSNVLLMVNVFVSSKASPTVLQASLTEIFSLLQAESLIFLVGSKNNMKLISNIKGLKQYVKCVFGPQKVTLNKAPVDEQISTVIGVKPLHSGHAYFIVWQKRERILKTTECERESSEETSVVECKDDSDALSESSLASSVENHNKLKHDLESSDLFYLCPEEIKVESPKKTLDSTSQNYKVSSVERITSALNDIKLEYKSGEEQKLEARQQDILQPQCHEASNNSIKRIDNNFLENCTFTVGDKISEEINKQKLSLTNVEAKSVTSTVVNNIYPVNLIMNDKPITDETSKKKRSKKKKVQSLCELEDQMLNENSEKSNCEYLTALQESSQPNSKISLESEKASQITCTEDYRNANNSVQSLLQRCDSLISKLEELTVDIKNEFNSPRKNQIKSHCCNRHMELCQNFHHGCSVKIVHSCCCRNFCKY